jgi:hypothetical protein
MTGIKKPKYSKSEVSQTFNLKKILGYSPSERQKEMFFNLAVDKMVQRTAQGTDINGKSFKPYSKEYAAEKGVSRGSVDLIREGDMLDSNIKESKQKNILKIKVEEGRETLKSFNHNTGDTLPKRNYFGFKDEKQLADVINQVDSIKDEKKSLLDSISDLAGLRQLISETIDVDFEGFDGES